MMVRLGVIVLGLSAELAGLALPQVPFRGEADYTVPVEGRPDLRPYATFPVHDMVIEKDSDDNWTMTFDLPRDLSGGAKIPLVLKQVGVEEPDKVFLADDNGVGSAECRVSEWRTARCSYTLEGLKTVIDSQNVVKYLNAKYRSMPQRRAGVLAVSAQIFGTEPIGEAAMRQRDQQCPGCHLGNGEWSITYTNPQGQPVRSEMSLARKEGVYFNSTGSGSLSEIRYAGTTATGRWRWQNSEGWFRFRFASDGSSFRGEWGYTGAAVVGSWTGERKD